MANEERDGWGRDGVVWCVVYAQHSGTGEVPERRHDELKNSTIAPTAPFLQGYLGWRG